MTSSGTRWGGFFSIALALEHPGRVRRLVLIGAPAGLDRPIPLFLRLWGNSITGALIRRMRIKDAETFRRRVYPLLVAHPERVPVDLLEMNVAAAALPGVAWSAYTMPRSVTTLGGFRRSVMLREELARLAVPTLFLWGDADGFAPPSSGRSLVHRMPEAAIEGLADTGHLPHVERPETVAVAATRFLTRDRGEELPEPQPVGKASVQCTA